MTSGQKIHKSGIQERDQGLRYRFVIHQHVGLAKTMGANKIAQRECIEQVWHLR